MIKNKKSQVTLFIVIGIVLLVGVVIFFYIRGEVAKREIAPGVRVAVEKLPTEFQPVASFVESCARSVGINALTKIGQTGGFDNVVNTNPVNPTESSAVELSPGSGLNVAYWYSLKGSNRCSTCVFGFDKPYLYKEDGAPSIESELGKYVDNNLNECLNDFILFSEQGINVVPLGSIQTDVSVTDDNIIFIVDYPLKLEREGNEKAARKFYAAVPLKLKKMYRMANYLTGFEASSNFIEKDVMNLIVGFSGVDENKLPPMADFRMGLGNIVRWRKSKVKEDIIGMLTSYISLLQVHGTKNYEEIDVYDELGNALYNEGMLIPADGDYDDLEVSFDYLGWDPYFDLNCRGEICEPETMSFKILQLFGMQNYNFVYDLSFPVLVSINDPDALVGQGYLFQFMLEANVRSNDALKTGFEPIEGVGTEESMFCDIDKRNSGVITINAKSPDDVLLDDVQVSYSCAGQNCFIGETANGLLEEKFPLCLGGIVSLTKEDYLGRYSYLDAEIDKTASLDVTLEPIRERKVKIKKKLIEKIGGYWTATLREEELGENEEAVVTLTRKSSVNEEEYMTTVIVAGSGEEDISLYSGEYDIDIIIMSKDNIVIPEKRESAGGFLGIGAQDYTIPKVEFDETEPYISGGLESSYEFTKQELENDVIVLYAVGIDLKGVYENNRKIEDLDEMNKIESYSNAYSGALMPYFE